VQVSVLLETVFLFLLLMIPGFLMGKCKALPDEATAGIGNIIMYIAMPALVFTKLLQTDLKALQLTATLCCILLPIALGLVLLLLGKLVFRGGTSGDRATGRFCSAFPNCGFWSIPLACVLFSQQPEVAVYVSIFNVFNSFLLLTAGSSVLSGNRGRLSVRQLLANPVLVAIILGSAMSLSGWKPSLANRVAEYLSALATPLSMVVLGAEAAKLKLREVFLKPEVYLACGLKLLVSPLLATTFLWLLKQLRFSVSETLCAAVFLSTAVSTALSAPSMAAKFNLNARYAAALTIGTTLLCVITMPLLYMLIF